MKIIIEDSNKIIHKLYIPNFLITNKLAISILNNYSKDYLDKNTLNFIMKEIKKTTKKYRNFTLVEIFSKDNEHIKITI
ncbi:MAG: hypothetical protein SO253_00345 [Bacilli bacterium]|nr:hypothetical protein [Bacilli bacterium]